jgi:hypothetical protein
MEVSCQQGGVRRNVVPCTSYESPPGEGMLLNRKDNKHLQAKKKSNLVNTFSSSLVSQI